jgi:hypothetical protein
MCHHLFTIETVDDMLSDIQKNDAQHKGWPQYKDIQHNDTQHKDWALILSVITLNVVVMLSVIYVECRK